MSELEKRPKAFNDVQCNGQLMESWVRRMQDILQHSPRGWQYETRRSRTLAKALWRDLTNARSGRGNGSFHEAMCLATTTETRNASCIFTMGRVWDNGALVCTKRIKHCTAGSDVRVPYKRLARKQRQEGVCKKRVVKNVIAEPVTRSRKRHAGGKRGSCWV